jgi:putative transposase
MPAAVGMTFSIPAELGPEAEVLEELRQRVRAVEVAAAAERLRSGRRVCGRRAVLQQSWRGQPSSRAPRRNLQPRIAAPSKWARIEAMLRNRAFIAAYAQARASWRDGNAAVFPPGTYWLRRFAHVSIAGS